MKFGGAPSTNIMDRCTRRQCQHSPAAPTGAGGDPSHHPHQGGRLGALTVRGSAARSFCSSGSQAQLATAYGCAVPNFTACSPVVQQHDYGKDHRGTLPAEAPRAIAAEESTAGMANETFKMGALRHPYGAGRATGGHARPRQAGPGNSRPGLIIKPRYRSAPTLTYKVLSHLPSIQGFRGTPESGPPQPPQGWQGT